MTRSPGVTGGPTAMLWDPKGQLSTFYNGTPEQQNRPTERYAYDAAGFRLLRWPESGDGRPLIAFRAATGRTTSEFVVDPTSAHPKLNRENVLLGGLVIAERHPTTSSPTLTASSPMFQSGMFGFAVDGAVSGDSFSFDIRTSQGFANNLGAVAPDGGGILWIPESALISGQRNWVSVRRESSSGEEYSNVAVVNYNASLTSSAANQVRSVSVSRSGTDIIVRWKVLQENGKTLRVYFHPTGGAAMLLTSGGLAPGTTQYILSDQALASPCGYFDMTQTNSNGSGETIASSGVSLPPSGPMGAIRIGQPCLVDAGGDPSEDPPPSPDAPALVLANEFHHRDHLGSLRIVTDSQGWKVVNASHDYYPFGREIEALARDLSQGSVSRYTGHERDNATGMDYMVMRSKSLNYPFFSRPDLVDDMSAAAPHSWNKYTYVRNSPLRGVDPLGLDDCAGADECVTSWGDPGWGEGDWNGSDDFTGVTHQFGSLMLDEYWAAKKPMTPVQSLTNSGPGRCPAGSIELPASSDAFVSDPGVARSTAGALLVSDLMSREISLAFVAKGSQSGGFIEAGDARYGSWNYVRQVGHVGLPVLKFPYSYSPTVYFVHTHYTTPSYSSYPSLRFGLSDLDASTVRQDPSNIYYVYHDYGILRQQGTGQTYCLTGPLP